MALGQSSAVQGYKSVGHSRPTMSFGQRLWRNLLLVLLTPVALPILALALVLWVLSRCVLYLGIWMWWLPQGKDVLLVSSDSPVWKEYMEERIVPLLTDRAIVLNWSERRRWSKWSFPTLVFRAFAGRRNFNPMLVLFRPLRPAKFFRFLPGFQELKHGNVTEVEKIRRELLLFL